MAPPALARRAQNNHQAPDTSSANPAPDGLDENRNVDELFVDPMMGSPLTIFVEKEVPNHDAVVQLIKKHGGTIGPNYSTVQYILVDPNKESGQNLFRQYHNKKSKVVLSAQWIHACVQAGKLMTFRDDWAGCKVTGEEEIVDEPIAPTVTPATTIVPAQSLNTTTTSNVAKKKRTTEPAGVSRSAPESVPTIATPQLPRPPLPSRLHPHQQATPPTTQNQPPRPSTLQQSPPTFSAFASSHQHHTAGHHFPPTAFTPWSSLQPSNVAGPSHTPNTQSPAALSAQLVASQHLPQPLTHLSQVHHRPPPLIPPYGVPSAGATSSRQSWYGVVSNPHPNGSASSLGVPTSSNHAGASHTFPFDHPPPWDPSQAVYYTQQLENFTDPSFELQPPLQDTSNVGAGPSGNVVAGRGEGEAREDEDERGRKRKRTASANIPKKSKYNPPPVTNPSFLVPALAPPRRSPSPPTRVVKSTYGGNLFTAEDIAYLKRYIDWCVDMGEVLSLREICERLAIKAPHHTFYSWRRYCNKHKIKLGSYQMGALDPPHGEGEEEDVEEEELDNRSDDQQHRHQQQQQQQHQGFSNILNQSGPSNSAVLGIGPPGQVAGSSTPRPKRSKSPTPPRSLHRSTTGKGIAFTEEDVRFLVRYLSYRREKDPSLNMPQFWNDLAAKAPHHSRASWLKYWRRHKHEIEVSSTADEVGTEPSGPSSLQVPQTQNAAKRQRYSQEDDILLAKFWATNPSGTSDKLFQEFAKEHPHHPWKGWQEHHRIHKTQIDHFVKLHLNGVDLDSMPAPQTVKAGRPPVIRDDAD